MGEVCLARVDERLIHGQVMTNLSKKSGANSIFIVDDMTATDAFMKNIFLSAGSRTGLKVQIFTLADAVAYWNDKQFENYKCILLTKTVDALYQLAKAGVKMNEVNLGGIAQKPGTVAVLPAVCIKTEDADKLKEMRDAMGIDNIYFQTIPSAKKVELADALKKF